MLPAEQLQYLLICSTALLGGQEIICSMASLGLHWPAEQTETLEAPPALFLSKALIWVPSLCPATNFHLVILLPLKPLLLFQMGLKSG